MPRPLIPNGLVYPRISRPMRADIKRLYPAWTEASLAQTRWHLMVTAFKPVVITPLWRGIT